MGALLCKATEEDVDDADGERPSENSITEDTKGAPSPSLQTREQPTNEEEEYRRQFQGSVYYDAFENEFDMNDDEPLEYAPATIPNPHPRKSVVFEQPKTLLGKKKAPKRTSSLTTYLLKQPIKRFYLRGYPGDLTTEELKHCQEFRQQLKERDEAYRDMVWALSEVEEEPYALCRFLRARKFVVDKVFEMMDESIDKWKNAKQENFFPDTQKAIGCPRSVILTQFPAIFHGVAKNGCMVSYLQCGTMSVEAVECVTDIDSLSRFFWNMRLYQFTKHVAAQEEAAPDCALRCEEITVMDLKGLSSSQVSRKAIDALKSMADPASCFPEVLNTMIILNAPGFFTFTWKIVKAFLDPRTSKKIEIYSDEKKAKLRMAELIEENHLPSDYGGKAPSYKSLVQAETCEKDGRRQEDALLSLGKNGKLRCEFALAANETADFTVYTNSDQDATFMVSKDAKPVNKTRLANKETTGSFNTKIGSNLGGPGTFSVEVKPGVDAASRGWSSSGGNDLFVVIMNVSSINEE